MFLGFLLKPFSWDYFQVGSHPVKLVAFASHNLVCLSPRTCITKRIKNLEDLLTMLPEDQATVGLPKMILESAKNKTKALLFPKHIVRLCTTYLRMNYPSTIQRSKDARQAFGHSGLLEWIHEQHRDGVQCWCGWRLYQRARLSATSTLGIPCKLGIQLLVIRYWLRMEVEIEKHHLLASKRPGSY